MSHNNPTKWTREITGSENAERLKLAHPVLDLGREKELSDRIRKEHKNNEVIELEKPSERSERKCLVIR